VGRIGPKRRRAGDGPEKEEGPRGRGLGLLKEKIRGLINKPYEKKKTK
jgi:hypothetical protein